MFLFSAQHLLLLNFVLFSFLFIKRICLSCEFTVPPMYSLVLLCYCQAQVLENCDLPLEVTLNFRSEKLLLRISGSLILSRNNLIVSFFSGLVLDKFKTFPFTLTVELLSPNQQKKSNKASALNSQVKLKLSPLTTLFPGGKKFFTTS